jgi:hypothetical protein
MVMTALILVLPQSNVLVISLESHRYVSGNDGRLFNGIRLCRCCAKVGMHC